MLNNLSIKAQIRLFATEEGGRKGYVASGYRPDFSFGFKNHCHGSITFEAAKLNPGEEKRVEISFFSFKNPLPAMDKYSLFLIYEGSKLIGHGVVLEVLANQPEMMNISKK